MSTLALSRLILMIFLSLAVLAAFQGSWVSAIIMVIITFVFFIATE